MGITSVKLKIQNPDLKNLVVEDEFLVDSGASITVLPQALAKKLKIKPSYEKDFVLADGKIVKRKIGYALISINGMTAPSPVVLGKKNDSKLLGALTLEAMGFALDPFERRIYKAKLFM